MMYVDRRTGLPAGANVVALLDCTRAARCLACYQCADNWERDPMRPCKACKTVKPWWDVVAALRQSHGKFWACEDHGTVPYDYIRAQQQIQQQQLAAAAAVTGKRI